MYNAQNYVKQNGLNIKLELYDADNKEVDYNFENGKFKGAFRYYVSEYDDKVLKFDVNIE